MHPSDAGLLAYQLIARSASDELKPWLRTLQDAHETSAILDPDIEEQLAFVREVFLLPEPPVLNAYLCLLWCFQWAVHAAPALAFEWLVGLQQWEADPQLMSELELEINRPHEDRLFFTLLLHKRHAERLLNDQGGERLALHHLQEVITLGERLLERYRARELQRGQRTLTDVEQAALVAVELAEAYRVHGDFDQAHAVLGAPVKDAESEAFTKITIAPRVLLTQGDLLERMGLLEDAVIAYEGAAKRTRLWFFICDPYECEVNTLLTELEAGLDPELVLLAVRSVANYYRAWALFATYDNPDQPLDPWLSRVQWVQTLLISARVMLPYTLFVEADLCLNLTLSALADTSAPQRALSSARALKQRDAIGLCEYALAKQRLEEVTQRADQEPLSASFPHLITALRRATEEAKEGSNVFVSKRLAFSLINLHVMLIQLCREEGQSERVCQAHLDELEAELERLLPLIARGSLNPWSARYDLLLLPISSPVRVQACLDLLMSEGRTRSVALLCWALRHHKHQRLYTPHQRTFAEPLREAHEARFERVWLQGADTLPEHLEAYKALINKRDTSERPLDRLQPRSGRLEFKLFEHTTLAVLTLQDQELPIALDLSLPYEHCVELVKEMTSALAASAHEPEQLQVFKEASQVLYERLIAPFNQELDQLHRLFISCDGPLHQVPFCALYSEERGYLVEQLELLMSEVSSDSNLPSEPSGAEACAVVGAYEEANIVADVLRALEAEGRVSETHIISVASFKEAHLSPAPPLKLLCLRGVMDDDRFKLITDPNSSEEQDYWGFTTRDLSQAIAAYQPACVLFADHASRVRAKRMIRAALSSVHAVVIAIHHPTPHAKRWVQQITRAATTPYRPFSYAAVITSLRRSAIQNNLSPLDWAAFELYVPEVGPAR
jgi:hypothetical protein